MHTLIVIAAAGSIIALLITAVLMTRAYSAASQDNRPWPLLYRWIATRDIQRGDYVRCMTCYYDLCDQKTHRIVEVHGVYVLLTVSGKQVRVPRYALGMAWRHRLAR